MNATNPIISQSGIYPDTEVLSIKTQLGRIAARINPNRQNIKPRTITVRLTFGKPTLKKLPEIFQNEFGNRKGKPTVIRRTDKLGNTTFEFRYFENGFRISASSTNGMSARSLFISALQNYTLTGEEEV